MKRMIMAALAAAFAMTLVLGVALAAGDPARGKASYDQMCASCHGPTGKGDGPAAAALNPKPKDLSDKKYVSGLKDDYMKKIIKEGGPAVGKSAMMAPMGAALKDADIENVIAYVRSLGK